jgi:hypothetical protein
MEIVRVRRPFWMHQIVEYIIGIALVAAAVQQLQPRVPALLGLVIILNASIAKGAAGAFRVVGKRTHRWLDLVVIGLLIAGAVQPWFSIDNVGRFMLGAFAFVMFFVWFHTDFTERVPRPERAARPTSARATGTTSAQASDKVTSEDIGRGAGRLVGGGVNSLRRWTDSFTDGSSGADD